MRNIPSREVRAYSGKVPINHLKIADIENEKQYLAAEFTEFYDKILLQKIFCFFHFLTNLNFHSCTPYEIAHSCFLA